MIKITVDHWDLAGQLREKCHTIDLNLYNNMLNGAEKNVSMMTSSIIPIKKYIGIFNKAIRDVMQGRYMTVNISPPDQLSSKEDHKCELWFQIPAFILIIIFPCLHVQSSIVCFNQLEDFLPGSILFFLFWPFCFFQF